ncbi:MAG: serine/threonine-protein kinase [Myxococcota bacterium]
MTGSRSADADATEATVRGAAEPARAVPPHARVGRYLVLEEVGAGAMGRVLRAYDPRLRREVALKLLVQAAQEHRRVAVVEEARAMAQLSHPNIVAVYDVEVVDAEPFLAMEYVDGETLRDWMGGAARPWSEVWPVLKQAARGLIAAHGAGLVHRDFKPGNVLVRRSGRVQVTDFGIAIDADAVAEGAAGTPGYMAPEQHDGEGADARADQFAFCITLWEALAGTRPFETDGLLENKRAGRLRDAAPIRALPSRVRAALERGLAPDPERRHPSMQALIEALEHRRSPWWWVVGGAAAIGLGVVAVGAYRWNEAAALRQRCLDDAAQIHQVWGERPKAAMQAAFEQTKVPHAADLFGRTSPWLDAYADDWARARVDRCTAEGRGQADAALSPLAQACFDEHAARFEATVAALSVSDPAIVHRSVKAASGLRSPNECADEAALRVRAPLPEDPHRQAQLADLTRRRAVVSAALAAGQARSVVADAETLAEEAQAIGWAPAVVDAKLHVAETREFTGDYEGAEAAAVEAFVGALAEDYDLAALSACARLVYVVGYGRAKPAEGLRWAATGGAIASRLGLAPDHPRRLSLINNTAVVHWAAADYEASKAAHEDAMAIKRAQLGPNHPALTVSLDNYGITLASIGDLDGAQVAFETSLKLVRDAYGEAHPKVTAVLTQLGTLAAERNDDAVARDYLERALTRIEAELGPDHADVALVLINLAGVELEANAPRSLAHAQRAYGLVPAKHPYRVAATLALGDAQVRTGALDEAETTLLEAVSLTDALPPEHPDRVRAAASLAEARRAKPPTRP